MKLQDSSNNGVSTIASSDAILLGAHNICKRFPGVIALNKVSLSVCAGEVHALMGENGAGKSTMMKILAGSYIPDEGTLIFKGEQLKLTSPRDALDHGIAMIHQELNLLPDMTVAENIWIGREPVNAIGLVNPELAESPEHCDRSGSHAGRIEYCQSSDGGNRQGCFL